MAVWNTVGTVVVSVLILAGVALTVLALSARRNMPVKFKTFDELNSVGDVLIWARNQVAPDDPRRKALMLLFVRIPSSPLTPPSLVRMSTQELALVAPFIDECIAGRGPPLNLPAEYEDWRPAALAAFKARMQAEGLWPAA